MQLTAMMHNMRAETSQLKLSYAVLGATAASCVGGQLCWLVNGRE